MGRLAIEHLAIGRLAIGHLAIGRLAIEAVFICFFKRPAVWGRGGGGPGTPF